MVEIYDVNFWGKMVLNDEEIFGRPTTKRELFAGMIDGKTRLPRMKPNCDVTLDVNFQKQTERRGEKVEVT